MIILNSETPIGLIATSPGAIGMISSTGSFGANSRVKISYSFSGYLSNIYAGLVSYNGNFSQSIIFPGSYLKFEIINPDSYNQINIQVIVSSELSVPMMPSGAIGIWYADEYQANPRPYIPNSISVGGTSANLFAAPRRVFSNTFPFWQYTGATITDEDVIAPDDSNDATSIVAAANWYLGTKASYNIPAGTYTMAISAKRHNTDHHSFSFSKDNAVTRSSTMVTSNRWQRFSYTFTLDSPTNNAALVICSYDGVTGVNMHICDFELYAGSSDLGPSVPSGHLYLGSNAFDPRPTCSGSELNLSSVGWGQIQLASGFTATAATTIALVSKVSAGSAYQAWISKMQNYTHFSGYTEVSNAPYRGINGTAIINEAGLWNLLNKGYHAFTHVYNGSSTQFWLDDILLFQIPGALTAQTVRDFFVGIVTDTTLSSGLKLFGMALYNRALSNAEIRDAYSSLATHAIENGLTATPAPRIYVAEGDSITQASGATSYAHKFGANALPAVFGNVVALNGSTIATMAARAATLDAILPPSVAGRKFILSVMIGRNDLLTLGTATWLVNLAAYLDARRAAGWIVVLGTILPSTAVGFNAARNTANSTLTTWVGLHCDAIANFAADATMGPDAAASNVTYYSDGTNPTNAGQVLLEAVIRPVINAL
jgi:hypothetical protein